MMLISFYIITMYIIFIMYSLFFMLKMNYYFISSRFNKIFKFFLSFLKENYLLYYNYMYIYFFMIFMFIFILNFFSLFTFIFSITSMSNYCMIMGFLFWLIFFSLNFFSSYKNLVSHLVPNSCPLYLISFMIFIEMISLFIRPITLSVRLMANITAGHLLLILVSNLFISSVLMIFLEIMVSMIQAYVFVLLLTLYFNESN